MKKSIVIGLDAAEPRLVEQWMAEGHLPNLSKKNPVLHNDNELWWNPEYVTWIQQALKKSIKSHSAIARELLQRDNWDLFLMVFFELNECRSSPTFRW